MSPAEVGLYKELLTVYGPLALGWVLALWLLVMRFRESSRVIETMVRMTAAMESLEKWVRERTP